MKSHLFLLRFGLLGFILVCFIDASAQKIQVESLKVALTDLSASTHSRNDLNGNTCALLKVILTVPNATFTSNIGDVKRVGSEYWVYLPKGTKKFQIKHPNYETLTIIFSKYGIETLESNTTYNLVLTVPSSYSNQITSTSQYLVFKVNPIDALVEVNDECWVNNDGIARKFVPFGTYCYRVQSKDYHSITDTVTVNDPFNKKVVTVSLRPNFGTFEILSAKEFNGASVYLDNKLIGQIPVKAPHVVDGIHKIRIVKSMYKPLEKDIIIKENDTTIFTPYLERNFVKITMTVANNAEIWVNEEKKGIGIWSDSLELGDCKVETRLPNHISKLKNLSVTSSMTGCNIVLDAPTPIYGSLNVNAMPNGATIRVDGKVIGETPLFLPQVLIGKHTLELTMDGYMSQKDTILLQQGKTTEIAWILNGKPKHEWVDLGLPSGTLWATCNVGASRPEEYGNYYAWGETTPDSLNKYTWTSYQWCNGSYNTMTKYCNNNRFGTVDKKTKLEPKDDTATVNWGTEWCMPSHFQQKELVDSCLTITSWTTLNGIYGIKITSKINGNSIFLPATGYCVDSSLQMQGSFGIYWSNEVFPDNLYKAWLLSFLSNSPSAEQYVSRAAGISIRPVRTKQNTQR